MYTEDDFRLPEKTENAPRGNRLRDHLRRQEKSWSALEFGKYEGKTIPFVILHDPDWFFWAHETGAFPLFGEAREAYYKARSIRIRVEGNPSPWVVYHLHYTSRSLWEVEIARSWTKSKYKFSLSVIDLGIPRHFRKPDKRGGRLLLAEVKRFCFPDGCRLTRKVCEAFFDDDSNFDLDRDPVAEEARAVVGT